MAIWHYGNVAIRQYGNMAIWQYGNVAMWRYGLYICTQPVQTHYLMIVSVRLYAQRNEVKFGVRAGCCHESEMNGE